MRTGASRLKAGNKIIPNGIEQAIDRKFPDAVAVDGIRHSDDAWTIVVLDVDLNQTVWLASLSLDHRWTLSPRENARVVDVTDMP